MLLLSVTPAFTLAMAVMRPAFLDEVPSSPGALFLYGLVAFSLGTVLVFGLKKPKGPGSRGSGSA